MPSLPPTTNAAPAGVPPAPTGAAERITNLDTVRGFATLGILVMNAVSFALPDAAYFNLDASGSNTWLDWVIGVAGEIFVDQKTMGLFSLLFGAGVVIFADRAALKARLSHHDGDVVSRNLSSRLLSLWRFGLLLVIGVIHSMLWEGDVLRVYAICAPLVLLVRNRNPRHLFAAGTAMVLTSALLAVLVQPSIPADGTGLTDYWLIDNGTMSDAVGLFLLSDFFLRALGMMLIGVALFRLDFVQGTRPASSYRAMVKWGLIVGLPLATVGVFLQAINHFSPSVSVIGEAPNTLATIPLVLAYLGMISLWNQRPSGIWHERIRAVGRMALTNYIAHTVVGVTLFRFLLDRGDASRTGIAVFVLAMWAAQLFWSKPWLDRFRFGPLEWLWRVGTYRKLQPLRR